MYINKNILQGLQEHVAKRTLFKKKNKLCSKLGLTIFRSICEAPDAEDRYTRIVRA